MGKSTGLIAPSNPVANRSLWRDFMESPLLPNEKLIDRAIGIHHGISRRYEAAWEGAGRKNGYFVWMCLARLQRVRDECVPFCPELEARTFIADIPAWITSQLAASALGIDGVISAYGSAATRTRAPKLWGKKSPPNQPRTRSNISKSSGAVMQAFAMKSDGWNGLPEAYSFVVEGAVVLAGDIQGYSTDKIAGIMRNTQLKEERAAKGAQANRSRSAETADGDAASELSATKRRIRKQRLMRVKD